MTTIPALAERIVDAMGRLVALAEAVDDEWTYIHDLEAVWVARLRAVAAERVSEAADPAIEPAIEPAIDQLVAEVGLITDPHRAIDWLSTLPQATLVAFGEEAW
ncbi:MAG: hypothetical protein ABIQ17_06825 [Candidatus Limnocylindrales bacterium]